MSGSVGRALARPNLDRLLVLRDEAAQELHQRGNLLPLELNIFDYALAFTASEYASGKFGELAREQMLRRCWDFSAAQSDDVTGEQSLWNGYARRFISGYVPRVSADGSSAA